MLQLATAKDKQRNTDTKCGVCLHHLVCQSVNVHAHTPSGPQVMYVMLSCYNVL